MNPTIEPTAGPGPADPASRGLAFEPRFTEGVTGSVYDLFPWRHATAEITDEAGAVIYRQEGIAAPEGWSDRAVNVVASKYFWGDPSVEGGPERGGREDSVRQLVDRVATTFAHWGGEDGYFATPGDCDRFEEEMVFLLLDQRAAFNSPVWFNVGLHGFYGIAGPANNWVWSEEGRRAVPCRDAYRHPQGSACFIQSVSDDMASIMRLAASEAMLFKFGSGTGTDLSTLRSSRERLQGGGRPSGPVSFMRIYDAVASVIKSGGKTRRAAKMQTLKVHHPDILEFVECKAKEDRKARALIAAGWPDTMTGHPDEAYSSVAFQNANLSVRATDAFMGAATSGLLWRTREVTTGAEADALSAPTLLRRIAEATWECGDPGMQFEDTIQRWHTCPNTAPINSSNPCLRRGSRLLTGSGWRRVEEIAARDGGYSPDVNAEIFDGVGFIPGRVWKTGRKPIVRLHANSGETLDLTADHRIYTTHGWVEAAACEGKMIPRVMPNIPSTGESGLPRAITGASGRFYNTASCDLMETLGFLQGDGGLRDGIATIYYTPEKDGEFVDASVLPILQDIAADKGEVDYQASPLAGRSGYTLSRKKLTDWLRAVGFQFVPLPERALPDLVWGAKRNAQAAFLRGLFGANGNVLRDSRKAVVLVSTCRRLLQEVQMILRTMGIMGAVRRHNKSVEIEWENGVYQSRESFHLEITHQQDIVSFNRLIGFPQACQQAKVLDAIDAERAAATDGGPSKRAFMEIIKVEDLGIEDDVYDFRAPTTAMGLCEGLLVHNCSEFMFIDDSACNLASLNLLKFRGPDGRFDVEAFRHAVRVMITAQEVLVDRASYPTGAIAANSHRFRPLGLGYGNLGALLMANGLPYDSDEGRALAGAVTAIMHGQAYLTSAELAREKGPFEGFAENREPMLRVIERHRDAAYELWFRNKESGYPLGMLSYQATRIWDQVMEQGERHGFRNSQVTVLAPTGTIAFMMDCDTTGCEPAIGLVARKKLAGGGRIKLALGVVPTALRTLGYDDDQVRAIVAHVAEHETVEGAPELHPVDHPVFACAYGDRPIALSGHLKMMAAIQPFLSGAISKTCNVPASATVEEIEAAYVEAWRLGLKAVAIYRDGSKGAQPLEVKSAPGIPIEEAAARAEAIGADHAVVPICREPAADTGWTVGGIPVDPEADVVEEGIGPVGSIRFFMDELYGEASDERTDRIYRSGRAAGLAEGSAPRRERLPKTRAARTHKFALDGHEGYINVGFYPDGRPGEVFLTMAKEGSTIGGLMDALGTSISIGLQYGVPLEVIVEKLAHSRYEPNGLTGNPDIPIARSLTDYVGRWLGMEFLPGYREANAPRREGDDAPDPAPARVHRIEVEADTERAREDLEGLVERAERARRTILGVAAAVDDLRARGAAVPDLPELPDPGELLDEIPGGSPRPTPAPARPRRASDAPMCPSCQAQMVRLGPCHQCPECFASLGSCG